MYQHSPPYPRILFASLEIALSALLVLSFHLPAGSNIDIICSYVYNTNGRTGPVAVHGSGDLLHASMNINGKESLWIDRGWRAADTDKEHAGGHMSDVKLLGTSSGTTGTTTTSAIGGCGGGAASGSGSAGSGSTGSSIMPPHGNYNDAGTDYAEVDTRNFSSFYNPCKQVRFVARRIFLFCEGVNIEKIFFIVQKTITHHSHRKIQRHTLRLCC